MEQIFDPLKEAQRIKQSICLPKDMNKLINVVAYHSNSQRQKILNSYKAHYNSNLIDDLKQELSGNFLKAIIALFYTPVDYDCYHLNKALKGLSTNTDTLIEILSTRSNKRISEIKIRFPQMFEGKDLIKVINVETSGFFKKILLKLLEGKRPDNQNPNENKSEECAKKLYEDINAKKDIMQETYINIFTQKSKDEFVLITQKYYKLYNITILETIEKSFSGDVRKVFKAITYALLSPSEYFAYKINKALKSFTTNDSILIRILVSRNEIDIERIKGYYLQLYHVDLYTEIKGSMSGDYKNLFLSLIGQ
jgi:annexin A7/11